MKKLFILFLMSFPALLAGPVDAAPALSSIPETKPLLMTYDVYVGGFHLIQADIFYERKAQKYHAQVQGRTAGIWNKLFPWSTFVDTRGRVRKNRFVPIEYYSRDVWDKKGKITKLHFRRGDVIPEFNPPNTDTNREIVTQEQRSTALDPVTALLHMLAHDAIESNCDVTAPVFDGKRRFDVIASDTSISEYIDADDYGLFKGKARRCEATFKSISGAWKEPVKERFWKKGEKGAGREPFHIWMGSIAAELPDMPVRIETGSMWGNIIVHLSNWRYAKDADIVRKGSEAWPNDSVVARR